MEEKRSLTANFSWKLAEKGMNQGMALIVSVVLARLLSPDDYGIIALVNVFILIANVFITNGVGVALIQDKDADEDSFSTDLIMSVILGVVLYIVLFFAAGPIAAFYSNQGLIPVIRVLALRLPLASVYTIQYAIVSRRMQFDKLFVPTLSATAVSGAVGIAMAYMNYGVWALVAQALLSQAVAVVLLAVSLKWRPKILFCTERAIEHVSFAVRVTAAELINTLIGQLNTLVIGKRYSSADVAYYNNGIKYPETLMGVIQEAVGSVMFPAIANSRESNEQVKALMRKSVKYTSFLIAPMMVGFALCAENTVIVLLTEKWLPCVPYMQIACMIFMAVPMNSLNYQAVKAIGKSGLFLKLQIIKSVLTVSIILTACRYGMLTLALANWAGNICIVFINAYPTHKYVGYSVFEQLKDLTKSWVYTVPFVVVISLFNRCVDMSAIAMLITDISIGVVMYFGTAFLLKSEELSFILCKLKGLRLS